MAADSRSNEALVKSLYEGLKQLNASKMIACYHPQATFEDPVFGKLNRQELEAMWKLLLSRAQDFTLTYSDIHCDESQGSGKVTARYTFSATGRPVINEIHSQFTFKEGKIFSQKDHFSLWKWTRQAVGLSGWFFGWLPNYKTKLQKKIRLGLQRFMESR
jgi:ketosteroid isomerase-like protein